ncbi:DUF550 domain-containing protein [Salmonella enterica]|nr:DUF550 domain-containing protein [Salmonella enterica]EDO4263621.1 DUF550 domain-containing protein [Salmonella enterica]
MTTITGKFTKERLIDWAVVAVAERGRDLKDAPESVEAAANLKLAEIALAALTAEPVRYLNKFSGTCVTLEQQSNAADDVAVYMPLYAAPPASERERIRREHAEWSDKTFGDVGPIGPLKHLSKEALEVAADPSDPLEWADMQFLLWDAQRRMGISDEFITRAMIEKLEINKTRQWTEPKDGEPRLHIKEQPAPVVPPAIEPDYEVIKSILPTANPDEYACTIAADMWNACRAAMLQGAEAVSNRDELPLDYLQGHKDGLEWAAQLAEANHPQTGDWLYDDPIELARAIRKGPDMPTVQAGNSPATQDGWISCSERMPNDKQYVWCWGKSYGWTEYDTFEGYYDWSRNKWWAVTDDGEEPASKVTHWMPLPAAPELEGNNG